jgi:hypothetical protein
MESGLLMAEQSQKKTILGYVSAYLKQTPRTYAEAERDQEIVNAPPDAKVSDVSPDLQSNPDAVNPAANEK